MKLIKKTYRIIGDNSGETIVEVVVAFALLSIMLLAFSEGIAWATRTEINASKSRTSADVAMRALQKYIATGVSDASVSIEVETNPVAGGWSKNTYTVTVDGESYIYFRYALQE